MQNRVTSYIIMRLRTSTSYMRRQSNISSQVTGICAKSLRR